VPDLRISTLEDLCAALDRVESRVDLNKVIESWRGQQDQSYRRTGFELVYDVHRALAQEGDE
jgi:hypothetical protein